MHLPAILPDWHSPLITLTRLPLTSCSLRARCPNSEHNPNLVRGYDGEVSLQISDLRVMRPVVSLRLNVGRFALWGADGDYVAVGVADPYFVHAVPGHL